MLGKSIAVLPRIAVAALHFTGLLYVLVRPRAGFGEVYGVVWSYLFCVYGVAAVISVPFYRYNVALISVIITMALASLSGFSPQLSDMQEAGLGPLFGTFYARWLGDALYESEVKHWGNVFDTQSAAAGLGYTLTGYSTKLAYV